MSMNLIADSGSTKTAWCLSYGNQIVKQFETAGINPFFQTEEEIATQLKETLLPQISGNDVEKVYFYGAGCADPVKNKALGEVLKAVERRSLTALSTGRHPLVPTTLTSISTGLKRVASI